MAPFEPLAGGPDALQQLNPILTKLALLYRPHGFAYEKIVNNFPVRWKSGQYPEFDMSDFYASQDGRPIPDDASTPIIDFKTRMALYHALPYRKRVRITREEQNNAHPALRLKESKITGLLDVFAGEREVRLAKKLRHTANGGQLTGGHFEPTVKWDKGTKASEATIQADITKAKQESYKKTGKMPNTLVLTELVAEAIALDFTLKDQLKFTLGMRQIAEGPGILPEKLFGLNVIVIGGAQTNTAAPGEATNLEEIWGKSVRVLYIDSSETWGNPSVAYGFRAPVLSPEGEGGFQQSTAVTAPGPSASEPNGSNSFVVVDQWAEPDPPANNYRVWECVDERIVAPELGVEIENVLT